MHRSYEMRSISLGVKHDGVSGRKENPSGLEREVFHIFFFFIEVEGHSGRQIIEVVRHVRILCRSIRCGASALCVSKRGGSGVSVVMTGGVFVCEMCVWTQQCTGTYKSLFPNPKN